MDIALLSVGLGSGLNYSLYSAVSKSLLKRRTVHPFLFLFYINAIQAIITPAIWCFTRPEIPPLAGYGPILAAAATCVVAYFFLYAALGCGDVSVVMPMMGSKVIFSGLLAHLVLHENYKGSTYLAAGLVAIAVAALSYSPSGRQHRRAVLNPVLLMLACCAVFGVTDVYIKRSLAFVDAYSFVVYYHFLVGIGSLLAIPYLRQKGIALRISRRALSAIVMAAVFLVGATLMYVLSLRLAQGIVVPNILVSSRGVFIVVISAAASHFGVMTLDEQNRRIYLLRFAASLLILVSIWLALS